MMHRIKRVQEQMPQQDLDAFLVMSDENRRYLTGFTGTFGWVLVTQNDIYLMTDFRYIEQAKLQAKHCKLVKFGQFSPEVTLRQLMEELNLYTIGIEADRCTFEVYDKLTKIFGRKAVIPVKGLVEKGRQVKDEAEIQFIAQAEKIGDMAFEHILNVIKPGITETEVATELECFMRKNGADGLSFTTIVASGKRSALPHGVAGEKKIENGDFVTMDYGCVYQGYCSDMTRTIAVGTIDERQKTVYNLVKIAQEKSLEAVHAGVIGKDIHKIAQEVFSDAGYGQEYFGHGLGHCVGLEIHEEPRFSPKAEDVISENMVISVEPGLYFPNWGGVRIEDLIVVKPDGYINLTHSSKELIIL